MGDFKVRHVKNEGRTDYYCHDDRNSERTVKFKGHRRNRRWRGGREGQAGGAGFSGGSQHLYDNEGDVSMGGDQDVSRKPRFIPYDSGRGNRRMRRDKGGRRRDRDRMEIPLHKQDGWFKVLIPFGRQQSKHFILQSIAQLSEVSFLPYNYRTEQDAAVFYVLGKQAANAIQQVNMKIGTPRGHKLKIKTYFRPPPPLVLDESTVEKLKQCMSTRFIPETCVLDLSAFSIPDTEGSVINATLERPNVQAKVVKIIEENVPTLRKLILTGNRLTVLEEFRTLSSKVRTLVSLSLSQNLIRNLELLDIFKDLQLEELDIQGNPMCDSYSDNASLVSAVRKRFPKVTYLNGAELPPQYGFDVSESAVLPPSQSNFFVNDTARDIIPQFLEQYFHIYDSGDRQKLLDAYHDQATFSVTIMLPRNGTHMLSSLYKETRNLMRINHNAGKKLFHQGKLSVVSRLCELPRTQHDPNSFAIDVTQSFNKYMIITCCGVFREVFQDGRPANVPMRAFNRVFVIIQYGQGYCIVNEMLNITNATPEQSKAAFKVPAPTPSPSPVPPAIASVPTEQQQYQMMQSFAAQSRLTHEMAQRCLQQNDWDYEKAAHTFQELFKTNQIPKDAFQTP